MKAVSWLGMVFCLLMHSVWAADKPLTVAFYYGKKPPLMDLRAFDVVVVDPEQISNPTAHIRQTNIAHRLFARLSLGQLSPEHPLHAQFPAECFAGTGASRDAQTINQTCAAWPTFFLDKIVAPLWQSGWRGFLLDDLARYQRYARTAEARAAQVQGMVALVKEFKRRYPAAELMLQDGFELLPGVGNLTFALAAGSLFEGYGSGSRPYNAVLEKDRALLLEKLHQARDTYHFPVVVMDYVDPDLPDSRKLARETAQKILALGFIPWVADGDLSSIGVSSIELLPRRILVVLEAKQSESGKDQDLMETEPHRFLGILFAHLGLSYEFVDLNKQPLPDDILVGRYAGIVTWFLGGQDHAEFRPWIRRHVRAGMRVAMFGSLGFTPDDETAKVLGIKQVDATGLNELELVHADPDMTGFETDVAPSPSQLVPIRLSDEGLKQGKILVRLRDKARKNTIFDGAALTAWGGFVWTPYEIIEIRMNDQTNWVINPLKFLRATLQLPDVPVPDVTSEGGRRSLLIHIDGDGFPSKAEIKSPWPDMKEAYGADIILRSFLEHYKFPTAMSIIESETSPMGRFPAISTRLEDIARKMMRLPFIEGASHSYTHPLVWGKEVEKDLRKKYGKHDPRRHDARPEDIDDEEGTHSITIEGYEFGMNREIKGSIDYINSRLMPPGKRVKVMLWTGDCMPPFEALEATYQYGFFNMNGGDTLITERNNSWTMIASQSLRKGGVLQIHAPHQNENVYTNDWEGPFYGFERVVQTFKLTDTEYRFKPVNIYYHTYAGTKAGSIYGLKTAYDWAASRPLTHIYPSEYIQKVLDFEQTTLSRDVLSGDLWVRTGDHLRTLRQSGNLPFSKWAGSTGVVGVTQYAAAKGQPEFDVTYLTLGAGEVLLPAQPENAKYPYLAEANGTAGDFSRHVTANGSETRFSLSFAAHNNEVIFTLAQAAGCKVLVDGYPLTPVAASKWSIYSPNHRAEDQRANTMTPIPSNVGYQHYEPKKSSKPDYLPTKYQVQVQCRG